jgi:hypothetical protein
LPPPLVSPPGENAGVFAAAKGQFAGSNLRLTTPAVKGILHARIRTLEDLPGTEKKKKKRGQVSNSAIFPSSDATLRKL